MIQAFIFNKVSDMNVMYTFCVDSYKGIKQDITIYAKNWESAVVKLKGVRNHEKSRKKVSS